VRVTVANKSLLVAFEGFVTLVLMLSACQITIAQVSTIDSLAAAQKPRVTGVEGEIAIGKTVTVTVDQLSTWVGPGHEPSKLVPYLNGRELKGSYPEGVTPKTLLFHLQRTPDTRSVWESLLREPVLQRPVSLSVGLENQSPFDTVFDYDHRLSLTVIPKTWGVVSLAAVLVSLILLIYLARNTSLLRHSGTTQESGKFRPYDEGRVQMAFWFFLITSAYLCLWLVTGDLDTVTPPLFGLMGISACTALGSHFMRKPSEVTASASSGFFKDILSDDNDYSFLNFQMLAWTLALGVIFVASVYDNLAMPKFNGALLALTGISSGTYLGFRYIEQQNRNGSVWSIQP
jgi:hypothetical protein